MVTIPKTERDPELLAKLKAESPGILAWAIEGCREWQRIGLAQPPAVRDATDGYLADEDAIGRFLKEYCVLDEPEALEEVRDLFAAWQRWCVVTGEFAGKLKKFSQALDSRNLVRVNPVLRRAAFARVRLLLKFDALMGPQPGIIVANRLAVSNSPPVGPIDLADSRPPTERDD